VDSVHDRLARYTILDGLVCLAMTYWTRCGRSSCNSKGKNPSNTGTNDSGSEMASEDEMEEGGVDEMDLVDVDQVDEQDDWPSRVTVSDDENGTPGLYFTRGGRS
jgi:hypothetical protein